MTRADRDWFGRVVALVGRLQARGTVTAEEAAALVVQAAEAVAR